MKPIQIHIDGHIHKTSQEICMDFLNTERWSEFTGYSILPGIKNAHFEVKTSGWVGSRIKVENTDGSSHIEEIIEWDEQNRIAMKFQNFSAPLRHLATHFIESWEFSTTSSGTNVTRKMVFYAKGIIGWIFLLPISRLMKKAFEESLRKAQQ